MNKFFILIFGILLSLQAVSAKEIKFVQITDAHFSTTGNNATQREVENSQNVLEKTILDINSLKNVDFIVFTGDNIDQANSNDLKIFLKTANKLNRPYYVVIGNHEVFRSQHLDKKEYMKIVRKHSKCCKKRSANYVFKNKGVVFLVVDGAKEIIPGPAGYYKKDTLKWLDKKLTKYDKKKVVIFQHFPIVEPYFNRTHMTYNVEDYEAVLAKHKNVVAIFSGHFHANGETYKNGIYHASAPALVQRPYQYKVVDLNVNKDDVQIYTQLRTVE